jgi:hypothetical protein
MDYKGFLRLRSNWGIYQNQNIVKMPRPGILVKGAYKFVNRETGTISYA